MTPTGLPVGPGAGSVGVGVEGSASGMTGRCQRRQAGRQCPPVEWCLRNPSGAERAPSRARRRFGPVSGETSSDSGESRSDTQSQSSPRPSLQRARTRNHTPKAMMCSPTNVPSLSAPATPLIPHEEGPLRAMQPRRRPFPRRAARATACPPVQGSGEAEEEVRGRVAGVDSRPTGREW